jgi:hypothetical protein
MSIKVNTGAWTPEQVWGIYQFLEQLQNELQQHHGKYIADCKRREILMEEYTKNIEHMTEEERMKEGVLLKSSMPDLF